MKKKKTPVTVENLSQSCYRRGLQLSVRNPGRITYRIMKNNKLVFSETSLLEAVKRVMSKPLIHPRKRGELIEH